MKNVLALILALAFTTSLALAAPAAKNTSFTNLGNAIKKDVEAAKDSIKKDVENAKKEQQAAKEDSNKEQKAALKEKRDSQIASIDKQINQKKQQIKDIKKSISMTETEKTLRIRSCERQIEALEGKKTRINAAYDKSINAIK